MTDCALNSPQFDPTPIFEHFRGNSGSELLTIAVAHFDIFGRLSSSSIPFDQLRDLLGLAERPANVLITALRAMGMLQILDGRISLTDLSREHLVPGSPFDVGNYVGLAAQSPGVLGMLELLKTNMPMGSEDESGAGFIYRDGIKSAMEAEDSARHFTMALAGRAKNVAPSLAEATDLSGKTILLDVAGGTGIYSYALLQKNPHLKAVVFDRPAVLKIAAEMAAEFGVDDRVELVAGDMFIDRLPPADAILLSNVLHDWDVPECRLILSQCRQSLQPGGSLFIHDVYLDDDLGGPLPIALYSASLFSFTEGRAYSGEEYRSWLREVGLVPQKIVPTMVHCGVLRADSH